MDCMSLTSLSEKIVQENSDAIVFSDKEGVIRLWNRGAEAMFGYSALEATGQSLDLFIPENLRERHWEGYHKVMASGVTRYGSELLAAPGICKDGTRLSLEFSMVIVRGEDGAVLGTGAIIRDITARFKKEKEMKARLKELEEKLAG
ncbi:MAG: PAS domain S-box protein [Geobacteraceae bacterium]|nr:PAS domain S-box protein [Geobacteraceae bacterium]